MKPASAKQKGRLLQQKVVAKLLEVFPQLEPDDIRSTSMGANGEDVQLSPAARRLIPHQIECKKHAKHAVYAHYDQCKASGPYQPLVVIEADRRQPLAVIDLDFYLTLLRALAWSRADANSVVKKIPANDRNSVDTCEHSA